MLSRFGLVAVLSPDFCFSFWRSFIWSSIDLLSQPRATITVYRRYNRAMTQAEARRDRIFVAIVAGLIVVNAFLYFLYRGQTYAHIDAIAHVNKARGLFDNFEP